MSLKGAIAQLLRMPAGWRFELAVREPEVAQWRKLREILSRNADTEFGRQHNFAEISSLAEYQQAVPIRDHAGFQPWLERMFAGESNLLTAQEPLFYAVTSGTAGAPKYSPITPDYRDEYQSVVHAFLYSLYRDHPHAFDAQALYFNGSAEFGRSPAGVPYGTMSGFNSKNLPPLLKKFYAVPYEGMIFADSQARYFCIALNALARSLSLILAVTASPIILWARTLQQEAERLIQHLHDGTLPADLVLSRTERELMGCLHRAHPARARQLSALLEREGWLNPRALWPKLDLIVCWKSSGAGSLIPELTRAFPDVPIRDAIYSASEGWCNVPNSDQQLGGPLAVHAHFYEFIDAAEPGPVLLAHQLQPGRQYRIIYTTSGGMYRYDIGDILQVSHLYRRTPSVWFVRKSSQFSNLLGERLDAEQVSRALQTACTQHNQPVPFYVMAPDSAAYPPCYRLCLELSDQALAQTLADEVDAVLQTHNDDYRARRRDRQLAAPQAWQLAPGSAERWRQQRLARGADEAQLKPLVLVATLEELAEFEMTPIAD